MSSSAGATAPSQLSMTHLDRLEAESIHIIREVAAEASNPVMLYSVGKDSAVMLHLAMKAFYPSPPPFPLMHVDTTWKFREMISFRDEMAAKLGMDLIVHINQEGVEQGIGPFSHGSALHTEVMKTQALKQALDKYQFDAAFGGARRDEEKSRAKERVFSFRTPQHRWDPKNQRPELWNIYNTRINKGESIRVFPLSNWTELDIWQYIYRENIPIGPLYLATERPVVERDGQLIMVDDDRLPLEDGETPEMRMIRFRTLGCYPLTVAVDSPSSSLALLFLVLFVRRSSPLPLRVLPIYAPSSLAHTYHQFSFYSLLSPSIPIQPTPPSSPHLPPAHHRPPTEPTCKAPAAPQAPEITWVSANMGSSPIISTNGGWGIRWP